MAERSSGPFMKMSPSGFPGLLIVLFVVLTSYQFFGDDFLWVLLGLATLGGVLSVVFHFLHSRKREDAGLSLLSHATKKSDSVNTPITR